MSFVCIASGGAMQCSRPTMWFLSRSVCGMVWQPQEQHHTDGEVLTWHSHKMAHRPSREQNCHHGGKWLLNLLHLE